MKYAILSDIHAHSWSQFSVINSDGVNSRLALILSEIRRAAATLKAEGGSTIIIAGDIFHTRGVMDPEVLNPVRAVFEDLVKQGFVFYAIPGNHDLKSRDTSELSSAIQNLSQRGETGGSFTVYNRPTIDRNFSFVPWRDTKIDLFADIEALTKNPDFDHTKTDLFIHAGIAGVLTGPTSIGEITAAELAAFGFKRVFAGHYHNHRDMGSGVVSIGALTHQNWGDIGTKAGFVIADTNSPGWVWYPSHAPTFTDISGMTEEDMELSCGGHYVRFRGPAMTPDQQKELRKQLLDWGANGVLIQTPIVSSVTRTTAPTRKGISLKDSISEFVKTMPVPAHVTTEEVAKKAQEVFDLSQSVVEE